jgi:radical SAM-linked protein
MERIRITFSKTGALRYIGHLDLHRMWERASRRAGLKLAYSQGFHPQPKIQLASALPLGFSSRCEVADLWLENPPNPAEIPSMLQGAVPPGLVIQQAIQVEERGPALQTQVVSAEYEITLLDEADRNELGLRLAAVMEAACLPRERRGKPYDLRPLIEAMRLQDEVTLFLRLAARESATGRPEEVLDQLQIPLENTRIERTRLLFKPESVE